MRFSRPYAERIALAGLAMGLTLIALTLVWAILERSHVVTAIFAPLAAGGSALGTIWIHDRRQRAKLQKWEPMLAESLGHASPFAEFPTLGHATEQLCRQFETALEQRSRDERESFVSTIVTLANALEARDASTRNHSAKVANFSVRLGRHMGLSHDQLYEIHLGGLLHDIGKIGIRDEILLKPTGLTRGEYEIMKSHPQVGYEILSGVPGMEQVADIVRHHHEMWDGSGYPSGLSGEAIPLGARLVAAADTYMALTEDRPYREGRALNKALKELRRVAGGQLDPSVVDHLEAMVREDRAEVERRRFRDAA